ncbi:uncharacterized protein [Amphiura filiformis]|uniref:uncharacterized protein n=1 Tax=Amphiura filiformis TaxID=82378 RepID=UPI003B21757D
MDPVTERLLERTRARREQLAKKMSENNSSPRKRRAPLAENNSQDSTDSSEDSVKSPSPVKTSRQVSMEIHPDTPAISSVKSRMQNLSQQRAMWGSTEGQELDSPKNVCAPRPKMPSPNLTPLSVVPQARKSRFAALAANINNWEDDLDHPVHRKAEEKKPVRVWQPPKPREETAPSQPIPAKRANISTPTTSTTQVSTPKQESNTWGYQPPTVTRAQPTIKSPVKPSPVKEVKKQVEETAIPVAPARACIRSIPTDSPKPSPRAASNKTVNFYGEKVTLHPVAKTSKAESTPVTVGVPRQVAVAPAKPTTPTKKQAAPRLTREIRTQFSSTSRERIVSPVRSASKPSAVLSPTKQEPRIGALAMSIQQRLKEHERNWQGNDINKKIQEERKKEMEVLRMRWEYPRPRPPTPTSDHEEEEEEDEPPQPLPSTNQHVSLPVEPEVEEEEEEEELEEQTPPVEEMEETMEDDQEEEEEEEKQVEEEDQEDMNITDVLGDIDELIDEAEAALQEEKQKSDDEAREAEKRKREEEEEEEEGEQYTYSDLDESTTEQVTPPPTKIPRSSSSSSESSENVDQSLMYSVERYRKNKNQETPDVKKIVRREEVRSPERRAMIAVQQQEQHNPMYDTPRAQPQVCPKQKIKALMEEVSAQQSIIHQTTQALNLIHSSSEYKGSMEEVEAERLLLLAAQRRHACLNEIQRLKNPPAKQGVLRTSEGEEIIPCSGSVTIQDIRLPLKTEYVLNQGSNSRNCHYYIVLLRQRENVIATHMLSTIDGLSGDCLPFTNMIAMNNIDSDFVVEVGIFEMYIKRKMDGHGETKSRSNFLNALTPKKLKSMKNTKMPPVSSPGGPGAIRTSAFTLVGTSRLSLASSKVSRFTLSKVPFNSPLEGSIHLKLTCRTKSNVTHRGWLTMFDDISGYGAWHRRWCVLNNGFISYWTFPDQEKIKPPIGSIDLHTSSTEEVAPISRILCARPNTFEVVTCRPASKYDKETLVTKPSDSVTSTMHRMSADTKEERIEWIDNLNTVLLDLRTWNKDPRFN